jgi:hypothetical protein
VIPLRRVSWRWYTESCVKDRSQVSSVNRHTILEENHDSSSLSERSLLSDKLLGSEFGFRDLCEKETRSLLLEESYNLTWIRWSLDGNTLGLVRTTEEQGYLDLFAWHDFTVRTTVELPPGVDWLDLYWISE